VQRWRRDELGLPPIRRGGLLRQLRKDRYPALYGFSPTLVPRPPDWGDWIQISGYWFAPPTASWVAPPALEEFLDGDGPVVFAGFGSLPSLHGEQLFAELCEAARRVRARVVTTTVGWLGEDVTAPDDNVFVLDEAPHDWLFPRVDAVVHHGGAGTTHYGARSGRPAVVVPTFGDQFFWGHRAATAGIAPPPIPRKKATADRLASALSVVLENPTMRQNADRVGMAIQAERGVDEAVAGLGRWLN
jgi:UDP:flavonoid glycosyltransferase YjiC (YdhE family)